MGKDTTDTELAHPEYWDQRYKTSTTRRLSVLASSASDKEDAKAEGDVDSLNGGADLDTYDWFRNWEHLQSWWQDNLPPSSLNPRLLHLGCGNSTLTADLYSLGFTNQTNVDFSRMVIRAMEAKFQALGVEWKVMDVRQMDFNDQTFDVAIDKATMDSMFHGSLWDPPDDVRDNIRRYLDEVDRILKPGATFIYITYRQPHFIKSLILRKNTWNLDIRSLPDRLGGVFEYFAYAMKKHSANSGMIFPSNDA